MKILIMGQPRSGKSTLARKLGNYYNIPVICTDNLRREWGYHEPWKGYETEINPLKQNEFNRKLSEYVSLYKDWIIEGNAINPKERDFFNADINVLIGRQFLSPEEQLKLSRKYDKDWTVKREDEYLLNLFADYKKYAVKWMNENNEIYYDTSNYADIEKIFNNLIKTQRAK